MNTMTTVTGEHSSPIIIAKDLLVDAPSSEQLERDLEAITATATNARLAGSKDIDRAPRFGIELAGQALTLDTGVADMHQREIPNKVKIVNTYPNAKIRALLPFIKKS